MSTVSHSHADVAFICGAPAQALGIGLEGHISCGPCLPASVHPQTTARAQALPGVLVLDTCVLLSNVLRRLLLRLAMQGCFIPVWSERIGGEWRRNAARIWNVPVPDVDAQWAALQEVFPLADQGEVSAFESGLRRSDPKDWHVIAAGRAAKGRNPHHTAGIVTRNIKDFNRTELRGYGLALFEPDELLLRLSLAHPESVRALVPEIPAFATAPGQPPAGLEAILKRERLFRFNRLYRSET